MSDSPQVQMAQAVRRQMDQADLAHTVDRTAWTDQQWIDDARALMEHPDGAITSLSNGHVMALLRENDRLKVEASNEEAEVSSEHP